MARPVGHDRLEELTRFERDGYEGAPRSLLELTGRILEVNEDDTYNYTTNLMGDLDAREQAALEGLTALRGGGSYSGEYAYDSSRDHDNKIAATTRALEQVKVTRNAAIAAVYTLVAEIYHELLFSELQATLFGAVQIAVDSTLAESGGETLKKTESVLDRLRDGDRESISQALTTCRRLIDAVADHLFPGQDDPYYLNESTPLQVKPKNYTLNRLQAALHHAAAGASRRTRLRQPLSNLYEAASKGTHDEVDVEEARFVFLQTYITLGEMVAIAAPPATTS